MTKHAEKKRVLVQVVQHLSPGGIETMSLDLGKFALEGHEVHIVSLEGQRDEALVRWPRLVAYADRLHFMNKQPGVHPGLVWQLSRLLRKLHAQVVHTHHIGPMLYGGLAARLAGIRTLIHTEHDAWHLNDPRNLSIVRRCNTWLKPQVVADAFMIASTLKEKIVGLRPTVIHNGIDTEHFSPGSKFRARNTLGLPASATLIGCAARLHRVKGHQVLLDALFRLPRSVHLALAGAGEEEVALRRHVKELGLEKRVHFMGHVENMVEFYRAVDVFCLASLNEGLPLSPLEAQSCGTPVVLTDVGACIEAVCPQTGVIVPSGDPLALAQAIESVLARSYSSRSPRDFVVAQRDVRQMVSRYGALAKA